MSELVLYCAGPCSPCMSGVAWAGAALVSGNGVLPIETRHGADGQRAGSHWLRAARYAVAVSAPLTILSGMYLFAALHPHDASAGGSVLKTGAAAACFRQRVGVLFRYEETLLQLNQPSVQAGAASSETFGSWPRFGCRGRERARCCSPAGRYRCWRWRPSVTQSALEPS